jgi:hypothetical protein
VASESALCFHNPVGEGAQCQEIEETSGVKTQLV